MVLKKCEKILTQVTYKIDWKKLKVIFKEFAKIANFLLLLTLRLAHGNPYESRQKIK